MARVSLKGLLFPKLRAITAREYMERVRSRWFVISTLFGPAMIALLLLLPQWMASRTQPSRDIDRIIILDATGTAVGRRIGAALGGGILGDTTRANVRAVSPTQISEAESAAARAVAARAYQGYLRLTDRTLAGRELIYVGHNATAAADMARLQDIVRREVTTVRLEQLGLMPRDASGLAGMNLRLDARRVGGEGAERSGQVSIVFALLVAVLLYFSIFLYGQNVLRGVLDEKQTRVAEVVVSSVSATQLLTGKVLGVGAVGLTQMAIWLGAGALLLRAREPLLGAMGVGTLPLQLPAIAASELAILVLFFVLGYTFYAGLFAAVGAMVSNETDAQQAQIPILLLLAMSIMFLPLILSAPQGTLAHVLSVLPFSSPIVVPLRMSVISLPSSDMWLSFVTLICGCYATIFVAARIYRVGLLIQGKRPSARQVMHWLRSAR